MPSMPCFSITKGITTMDPPCLSAAWVMPAEFPTPMITAI